MPRFYYYLLHFLRSLLRPAAAAVGDDSFPSFSSCFSFRRRELNACDRDRYSSSEYHNGRRRRPPPLVLTAHPETTAPEDDAGVMAVALSPDGTLVAAGCVDALVRVWALAQG